MRTLTLTSIDSLKTVVDRHYRKQELGRVSTTHGEAQKTLGKQHTAYTVTAKVYLPSVFYQAFGKDFAEC